MLINNTTTQENNLSNLNKILLKNREFLGNDPTRPTFHFLPPAGWMNDPNGTIYYKGYYHIFYQHNPHKDTWGNLHWGHARSKDLINWEYLPIALVPEINNGELSCYSGSCIINNDKEPMIFYTRVGIKPEHHPRDQWIAKSDNSMIEWTKYPQKMNFYHKDESYTKFIKNWRDPFVFKESGKTFLIIAVQFKEEFGGEYAILIYEAINAGLTEWSYRSTLLKKPSYELSFLECPNFFKMGDKWILLVSPYKPVEYYIGFFDSDKCIFDPISRGHVDFGIDYYATQILKDPNDRTILFSWVRGFQKGRGWNGCLALPREVQIKDNKLVTTPIKEVEKLRGELSSFEDIHLEEEAFIFEKNANLNSFELKCNLEIEIDASFEIIFLRKSEKISEIYIRYDGSSIDICGNKIQINNIKCQEKIDLHVFVDHTVIEIFINDGEYSSTKVIYPKGDLNKISVKSLTSKTLLKSFLFWPINHIKYKTDLLV